MQLPWDEHFHEIVIPAWQQYRRAERELSAALAAPDVADVNKARYAALREGGAASFYLHHFAEVVLRARPEWLPDQCSQPADVWRWVAGSCTMLRTDALVGDVKLLGDVADALKHAVLTRRVDEREVAANEAVLVVTSRYGELRYGEGKFGGGEQVVVRANSGARVLSSVLQNVVDAWRRAAGLELPAIGQP